MKSLSFFLMTLAFSGCSLFSHNEKVSLPESSLLAEKEDWSYGELIHRDDLKKATFAGGCFWCMEGPFEAEEGVLEAISGYAGGEEENPTYAQVASGTTGHREAVQIFYNPQEITYAELLKIYWKQIDPFDAGGQFSDRGKHYTTAIFYHSEEQKMQAEASKKKLEVFSKKKVATQILPFSTFYPAEPDHQDFYKYAAQRYQKYKKGSGRAEYIAENEKERDVIFGASKQEKKDFQKLREQLSPLSKKVMLKNGTEKPFANEYWDNHRKGIYVDRVTGEPLFASVHKYTSGTGWPSFDRPIRKNALTLHEDNTFFTKRTEVRSVQGNHHLGHVFDDGPPETTGKRYCMNSAAMRFVPLEDMEAQGYGEFLELFKEE